MVLVEATKGDSDLRIQLGIWGVVALKGFSLIGLEIMYFFFLLYDIIRSRIHGLHCQPCTFERDKWKEATNNRFED